MDMHSDFGLPQRTWDGRDLVRPASPGDAALAVPSLARRVATATEALGSALEREAGRRVDRARGAGVS